MLSEQWTLFLVVGEPKDRHVVIVDDLVQTGGTLIQCAKVGSNS